MALADLDGDGRGEIVAGSYDKHVYALTGAGKSFWSYKTGAAVYALDAGDLDGDGGCEVVAGGDDNRVHALSPDGLLIWKYQTASRVVDVLVEDVDADGLNDVVAASWGRQLYLLAPDGDLRWQLPTRSEPSALQCGDLDNDGQLEIVVGSQDGEVCVVGADGTRRWEYRTGGYVRELAVEDLDGDGREEIIVGSADGSVYTLSGEGQLEWRRQLESPVVTVYAGDVDGDGSGEVVVGTGLPSPRICLLSDAGEVRWSYQAEKGVWVVLGADVDGAGSLEILGGADDGGVWVLDVHGRLRGSYHTERRVHGLVLYDLDGDDDKAVVARSGNDVYLLTFSPADVPSRPLRRAPEPATVASWTEALPGAVESGEDLIELVAVGDIMLSRTVEERMDLYGSQYPFGGTADLIRHADIAIGNLECPLSVSGQPIQKRFTFRAHPRHVRGLAWAGFDILSLANNHLLDFGGEGFCETVNTLDRSGLPYVGAGLSYDDAHRARVLEVKGRKVAFLAYAASRWRGSPEVPTEELIAFADSTTIREDVARATQQADLVVVIMHLGAEYRLYPDEEQLAVARTAIEAGASLVIGHHPHVVQGTASYAGGFIAYSIGNFVFDIDVTEQAREGAMLRVLLGDDGVEAAELIPVRIVDDVQPRFLADEEGHPIVKRVF